MIEDVVGHRIKPPKKKNIREERNKMLIYKEKSQMLKSIACSNGQFFI